MHLLRAGRAPPNPVTLLTASVFSTILGSLGVYFSSIQRAEEVADNISGLWRQDEDHYDFVIIGGGTAGGVLANRLSEIYTVLVLEAGGDMNEIQQIPAMSLLLLKYPEVDWIHRTAPQDYSCYALLRNRSHWSAGKGLGGSSNMNFLIQSRGNPKDYNNWANLTEDKNWDYEHVLPHFKRSENYHGIWGDSRMHGKSGPIDIQVPDYTGMSEYYLEAARELGYHRVDLNGYYTQGFDTTFYSLLNGRRQSVYSAYIAPARNRTNLTIKKFATVKKILMNGSNRAHAVEYDQHSKARVVYAHKEIILSAGTMNSAKLLMLSGIGPKEHLEQIGIPVLKDLPVGKNLQDHISTYLGPFFMTQPVSFNIERDGSPIAISNWFTRGTGPLTSSGIQAMGFVVSEFSDDVHWPDTQLLMSGVSAGPPLGRDLARAYGIKEDVIMKYFKHAAGKESFSQMVSVARPQARGQIKLKSQDPYNLLNIDPRYLDNEKDMKVLISGIKKSIELVEKTSVFQGIGGKFTDKAFPGCEGEIFRTDEYWECYARHLSLTMHHFVGTCSMGSVVDTQLRVYGFKGLRVIDASVMPQIVTGETSAPTIMIAEKGADMILKYWNRFTE